MRLPGRTTSNGIGSAATRATRRTSAPTPWRTGASMSSESARLRSGKSEVHLLVSFRPVRQIVLDTETTGLEVSEGHRIIELGCIELRHRRPTGCTWHRYLKPGRDVDPGALAVHGITNDFLAAQPAFAEVVEEFLAFV